MSVAALLRYLFGSEDMALEQAHWAVVDCETTGLDTRADRVLSIGAVKVDGGRVGLDSGFAVTLRQESASGPENCLVHGIGGTAQLEGVDPAIALEAFDAYAGDAVLVAYHAEFDRTMLEHAMQAVRGLRWKRRWMDLAGLLPALFPGRARACRSLDDWLSACGVDIEDRHDALADAFASAQLLQIALAEGARQGAGGRNALLKTAASARWIG